MNQEEIAMLKKIRKKKDGKIKKTEIMEEFKSIDICLFSTGTYDPKQEQNIDIEKIENVMDVNFMGIVKCVKAVEDYFKNKRTEKKSRCIFKSRNKN